MFVEYFDEPDSDKPDFQIERGEQVFFVRTPQEALRLADWLTKKITNGTQIAMGLKELLINAIEHGNLEIGFDEKTRLLKSGAYMDEVYRRLRIPEFDERLVQVRVTPTVSDLTFTILDRGKGFDPARFLKIADDRLELPHGRGIAIAIAACFDTVEYNSQGNMVQCTASC